MGELRAAVGAAIEAADHLRPSDGAAVALAKSWASQIDKQGGEPSPGFLRLLNALGLTPQGRKDLAVGDEVVTAGALSGIRQRRAVQGIGEGTA
ncbi:hypothetical protein RHDE110596_22545 [Prescottella defluvii]